MEDFIRNVIGALIGVLLAEYVMQAPRKPRPEPIPEDRTLH
jgi:hypothetical protein